MPTETDEDGKIDEILAELKNDTSEESIIPKKEIKNPYKDKKNDESNTYEFEDKLNSDEDW